MQKEGNITWPDAQTGSTGLVFSRQLGLLPRQLVSVPTKQVALLPRQLGLMLFPRQTALAASQRGVQAAQALGPRQAVTSSPGS